MEQGWTKRWRKRWRNGYHRDLLLWALMDYFIDFAAYEPHKQFRKGIGLVELQRGEWVFSERELADFFGVDRGQIRVRLNLLSEIGFSTHETTQRATKIKVINYDVYQNNEPSDNPTINPETTQRQPTDNPPLNNKKVKKVKKCICPMPDDFVLSPGIRQYAEDNGIPSTRVQFLFDKFCDYHRSKGNKFADWVAAWRTWVRNEVEFKKQRSYAPIN